MTNISPPPQPFFRHFVQFALQDVSFPLINLVHPFLQILIYTELELSTITALTLNNHNRLEPFTSFPLITCCRVRLLTCSRLTRYSINSLHLVRTAARSLQIRRIRIACEYAIAFLRANAKYSSRFSDLSQSFHCKSYC